MNNPNFNFKNHALTKGVNPVSIYLSLHVKHLSLLILLMLCLNLLQAQTPFTCANQLFQTRSGQLMSVSSSDATLSNIGPAGVTWNSAGFNIQDQFIYGLRQSSTSLLRFDANGNSISIGTISGGFFGDAADFDESGNFFIYKDRDDNNNAFISVDVSEATLTTNNYTLTGPEVDMHDIAYNYLDGSFYGVSNNIQLVILSPSGPNTFHRTLLPMSGPILNSFLDFGSVWMDAANDTFYAFNNGTGQYFSINLTTRTSSVIGTDNLSLFNDGISCRDSSLPIELKYFKATKLDKSILLTWETTTEENNDFFTLEKSTDGKTWETITTVDGAGNSAEVISYRYEDLNPYTGNSYYRLRQTDFDGTSELSKVQFIYYSLEKEGVQIFPNPARQNLLFNQSMWGKYSIVNMLGQNIVEGTLNGEQRMDISLLNKGQYIFLFEDSDYKKSQVIFTKQ